MMRIPKLDWLMQDQAKAFNEWKEGMDCLFATADVKDSMKWNFIKLSAGIPGRDLCESWQLTEADKQDTEAMFARFKLHMVGDVKHSTQDIKTQSRSMENSHIKIQQAASHSKVSTKQQSECKYCGTMHQPKKCPAYGKECRRCGRRNHYEKVCKAGKKKDKSQSCRQESRVQEKSIATQEEDDPIEFRSIQISTMKKVQQTERQSIMVILDAKPPTVQRKVTLQVKADTSAKWEHSANQMFPPDVPRSHSTQRSAKADKCRPDSSKRHHHSHKRHNTVPGEARRLRVARDRVLRVRHGWPRNSLL